MADDTNTSLPSKLDGLTFDTPSGYTGPDQFDYKTVTDAISNQPVGPGILEVDEDFKKQIDKAAAHINLFDMGNVTNLNNPFPGRATQRYNPFDQENAPDLNSAEGINRFLTSGAKEIEPSPTAGYENPIEVGIRSSNFDRYYNHPNFGKLGWHPYADNESYYNQNSDMWDDMARMGTQWGSLAGTGFLSVYRSMGDMFDGRSSYLDEDVLSAFEFEDAMRIGNSTKGGLGEFVNNFALNSAYTFGIIGSIAAEELALAAATWASAGILGPGAAVKTAQNVGRGAHAVGQLFDVFSYGNATKNLLKTMQSTDKAKDFWTSVNAGGALLGDIFTPELRYAIKELNSAKSVGNNLSNMAKANILFGGFYRQARSANLAFAESKMEGGMVYNSMLQDLYTDHKLNYGDAPSTEQITKMQAKASQAGFATTVTNAPVIYFSNQFVLGTAFRGFKPLANILNETMSGIGGRILKDPKLLKSAFYDAGEWGFKRLYNMGIRGGTRALGAASLRYTSANFAEGFQELAQEAIAVGTTDYYTGLYKDPTMGGVDLNKAAVASAIKGIQSQAGWEGFEVFMSGFLMGGLVQPVQNGVFKGLPYLYNITAKREDYKDYQDKKTAYIDNAVKALNEGYDAMLQDPKKYFDPTTLNAIAVKQLSEGMLNAGFEGDALYFYDEKDALVFHHLYTALQTGKIFEFVNQLEDFRNMDQKDLLGAFPDQKEDVESGKMSERFTAMIGRAHEMEKNFKDLNSKFINPYDSSQHQLGSREYDIEYTKELAFNHAKMLMLFTRSTFERALERSNSIYESFSTDPIISKMAANEIALFTSAKNLKTEIHQLESELELEALTDEQKDIKARKKRRLKLLNDYLDVLTDPENWQKDKGDRLIYEADFEIGEKGEPGLTVTKVVGIFDRRRISSLVKPFVAILKDIAAETGDFYDPQMVKETLKKIVDYKFLKNRGHDYFKAIETLLEPGRMDSLVERISEVNLRIWDSRKKDVRERIKKYISLGEKNEFLNQLAKIDVYPTPEGAELFLVDDVIPTDFRDKQGPVNQITDPNKYKLIQDIIKSYNKSLGVVPEDEATTGKPETEEQSKFNEIIESATKAGTELSEGTRTVLSTRFNKELLKDDSLLPDKWMQGKLAQNIIKTRALLEDYYENKAKEEEKGKLNFEAWLTANKGMPEIGDLINTFGLDYSDVSLDALTTKSNINVDKINANETILDQTNAGGGFIFKKIVIDGKDGEKVTYYSIVNGENESLINHPVWKLLVKEDVYIGKEGYNQAKKIWDVLKSKLPSEDYFTFDGIQFIHGQVVKDKNGKKFKVYSTSYWADKTDKLNLVALGHWGKKWKSIPQPKINRQQLKPGQWAAEGWTIDAPFKKAPEITKKAKLRLEEPVLFIPYSVGKYDDSIETESLEETNARFQSFLRNLTPEERGQLELVISHGQHFGRLAPNVEDRKVYKSKGYEDNPQIRVGRVQYTVELRVPPGSELAAKFSKILKQPTDTIGYLQGPTMATFLAKDLKTEINPLTMTPEEVGDYFILFKKSPVEAAQYIRNTYAKSQVFQDKLAELLSGANLKAGEEGEVTVKLNELEDISINVTPGSVAYGDPISFADELEYKFIRTAEESQTGENIVFILDYQRGYDFDDVKRTKSVITNLSKIGVENEAEFMEILDEIEDDIAKNNTYNIKKEAGRYLAVVKLPNGTITYVPLESPQLDTTEKDEIAIAYVNRQDLTQEVNIEWETVDRRKSRRIIQSGETKGEKHGMTFNNKFNEDIQLQYYITGFPGMTMHLTATPLGDLKLDIQDKNRMALVSRKKEYWETSVIINKKFRDAWETENQDSNLSGMEILVAIINAKIDQDEKDIPAEDRIGTLNEKTGKVKKWRLTVDSFRKHIPSYTQLSDIEDANIETEVNNPVRKDIKLELTIAGEEYKTYVNTAVSKPIDKTRGKKYTSFVPEDGLAPEDTNVNTDPEAMSSKQKADHYNADFVDYPIGQIVDKLIEWDGTTPIGDYLTEYEVEVYNNRSSDINIRLTIKREEAHGAENDKSLDKQQQINKDIDELEVEIKELQQALYTQAQELYPNDTSAESIHIIEQTEKPSSDNIIAQDLKRKTAEKKAKLNDLSNLIGLKVTDDFDGSDIEDIDVFINWVNENLPSNINVKDIGEFQDRLKRSGTTVGAFVLNLKNISNGIKQVDGTIYTGANSPYKYHEAFHSVFRMLLSEEEIKHYLSVAKKEVRAKLRKEGKSFKEELKVFRNLSPIYMELSPKKLEELFYEEYLADEFDKFKKNQRTSKETKSLFQKIIDWILEVFRTFSPNELTQLFRNIDSGKYSTSRPKDNRFTEETAAVGITRAYKQIKLDTVRLTRPDPQTGKMKTMVHNVYETAERQRVLISTVAGMFLQRELARGGVNPGNTLDEVLNDYIGMYNARRDFYTNWKDKQTGELINSRIPVIDILDDLNMYFKSYTAAKDEIKAEVLKLLQLFDAQTETDLYSDEVMMDGELVRNIHDFDKDANQIGGYSSLPRAIRAFLATITMANQDEFGNSVLKTESERRIVELIEDPNNRGHFLEVETLEPEEPLIVGTDYLTIYNGLLKATKDTKDQVKIVQKMWAFAQGNPQTHAAVTAIFDKIGITPQQVVSGNLPRSIKNPNFFTAIVKGFGNFRVDNLFVQTDPNTGLTHVFAANNKDDSSTQLDAWNRKFSRSNWEKIKKSQRERDRISNWLELKKAYFVPEDAQLSPELQALTTYADIESVSRRFATEMYNNLGIKLSPTYIAFSIGRQLVNRTGELAALVAANEGDVRPIEYEDLDQMSIAIQKGQHLMLDVAGLGVKSRLKKWANGNGKLDETVGSSTFVDSAGNIIYAHIQPSFQLEEISGMNDVDYLTRKRRDGFLAENMLLNSPEFEELLKTGAMRVVRINGSKVAPVKQDAESGDLSEDTSLEVHRQLGTLYGKSSGAQFAVNLVNAYVANYNYFNQKTVIYETDPDPEGNTIKFTTSPVLIRVIESGNQGDMAMLPVKKTVVINEDGDSVIADETVDQVYRNIQNEYKNIDKEINQQPGYNEDTYKGWNDWLSVDEINDDNPQKHRAAKLTQTGEYVVKRDIPEAVRTITDAPLMPPAVQARIAAENQKIILRPGDTATKIKLIKGDSRAISLQIDPTKSNSEYKDFIMYNRGPRSWNELSDEAKSTLLEMMGDSKSIKGTKKHKYYVKELKFYFERKQDALFVEGKIPQVLYEFVPIETAEGYEIGLTTDKAAAELKENYGNKSISELTTMMEVEVKKDTVEGFRNAKAIKEYLREKEEAGEEIVEEDKLINAEIITEKHIKEIGYEYTIESLDDPTSHDFKNVLQDIRDAEEKGLFDDVNEGKMWIRENLIDLTGAIKPVLFRQDTSIKTSLEQAAREGKSWDDALNDIGQTEDTLKELIRDRLAIEKEEFVQMLIDINAYAKLSKAITKGLQNDKRQNTPASDIAMDLYNLRRNDPDHNISQIFFNDLLNTSAINELILGNEAMTLKDAIDAVKRAKMQAAAGPSAATIFAAPELGVRYPVRHISALLIADTEFDQRFGITSPEGEPEEDGSPGESTDGQVWGTVKAFNYLWYGFGKLSTEQAGMLKKIDEGVQITSEEIFEKVGDKKKGLAALKAMMNSKKLVYGDGINYDKMSFNILTKEWTSEFDPKTQSWIAKPHRVDLHNMREKMEAEERRNPKTIVITVPQSASKMAKKNILSEEEAWGDPILHPIQERNITVLDAGYMRLQQITPSNKVMISSPTQIKALILSEHNNDEEVLFYGVPTSLGKLRDLYNKANTDKTLINYFGKRSLIFNFPNAVDALHKSIEMNEITVDLRSFLRFAEASLSAGQSRSQMMELFSVDETGNQKYPLNGPQTVQKFTELFMTYFSTGTLNEKLPGHSYSTVSDRGVNIIRKVFTLDKEGQPDRSEVVRTDQWESMALGSRPTLVRERFDDTRVRSFSGLEIELERAKDNGKDYIYIVDRLRHNMKMYDENGEWDGERVSEFITAPHFKEVMDKIMITQRYVSKEEIQNEYEIYVSTPTYSPRAKKLIIRLDIVDEDGNNIFDPVRAKAEFAYAKGYRYNVWDDVFEDLGNKDFYSIPAAIAKQLGIRIPSQDKHSAVNLRLVDFMPAFYGSSAVFPEELIEITGWDFDIDQVYTQIKEWYNIRENFYEYGKGVTEEEKYADYIRWIVSQSYTKGSLIYEALLKFNDVAEEEIAIDQFLNKREIERLIGPKPPETAPKEWKDQYDEDYKTLFVQSLLSFVQRDSKSLIKLWGNQVKEAARGSLMGALEEVNLPITFDDYTKYKERNKREPYEAPMNNEILDIKYAILSSEGMTSPRDGRNVSAAFEPATEKPLMDVWKELQREAPEFARKVAEQGYFTNSLLGKTKAFMANKADVSIGAAVLPNLVMNILNTYDIGIRREIIAGEDIVKQLMLNNITYDSFGVFYELDTDPTSPTYKQQQKVDGKRTHYVISAIVSAAVDNAKERLISKLGLNKDALALVTNMVALGVTLKTAIMLINHPTIRYNYFLALNKERPTDAGIVALIKKQRKLIYKSYKKQLEGEEFNYIVDVTDDLLIKALRKQKEATFTKLSKVAGDYTIEDAKEEIAILDQFLAAHNFKDFTGHIQGIITLNAGFGRDIEAIERREESVEELGLEKNDKEFKAYRNPITNEPYPMDVRSIFKGDAWQATYYEIYRELVDNLLPAVLLSRTPDFMHLKQSMLDNMTQDGRYMTAKQKAKLEKNMISYLTIKAYMKSLIGSPLGESLQNGLIYDQKAGLLTIDEVVKGVKDYLNTAGKLDDDGNKTKKDNFFIDQWADLVSTSDLENYSGTNYYKSNTFTRLDDWQLQYVQNSFAELYSDANTRQAAYHISHFLMVHKGMQYSGNTIMDAIPPFIMDRFLYNVDNVHNAFKMTTTTDPAMRTVFGLTLTELKNEFLENYGRAAGALWLLPTMQRFSGITYDPPVSQAIIKKSNYDILAVQVRAEERVYAFGETISRKGNGGPQGQRSIRAADNAIPIYLVNNANIDDTALFDDENLEAKQVLFDEAVEALKDHGGEIIFPVRILEKKLVAGFKKNAPNYFKYVKDGLINQFGYNIEGEWTKATKTKKAKNTVTSQKARSSYMAIKKAVVIDESQEGPARLIADEYKGLTTEERMTGRHRKQLRPGTKGALAQEKALRVNQEFLEDFGFKQTRIQYYTDIGDAVIERGFPMNIRVNMTTRSQQRLGTKDKYRYFTLDKVWLNKEPAKDENLASLLREGDTMIFGNKAEYVEYEGVGSRSQWEGGFMFDNEDFKLPTTQKLRSDTKIKHAQQTGLVIGNVDAAQGDAQAAEMLAKLSKMEGTKEFLTDALNSAKSTEVTNDEIKLDNKNVAEVKPKSTDPQGPPNLGNVAPPPGGFTVTMADMKARMQKGSTGENNKFKHIIDWYNKLSPEQKNKVAENLDGAKGAINVTAQYQANAQVFNNDQKKWTDHIDNCFL